MCIRDRDVTAMRNPFGVKEVMNRGYVENVTEPRPIPTGVIPTLLDRVRPVHELVLVDVFVPGCPPSADLIYEVLGDLIAGKPVVSGSRGRFGG